MAYQFGDRVADNFIATPLPVTQIDVIDLTVHIVVIDDRFRIDGNTGERLLKFVIGTRLAGFVANLFDLPLALPP